MSNVVIAYDDIFTNLPPSPLEERILKFQQLISELWLQAYLEMPGSTENVYEFDEAGFTYFFDISSELTTAEIDIHGPVCEDRVVAVYGKSQPPAEKRDASRMKGFLGPSKQVFGENYDKGHFMAHTLGGGLDVNLFPQRSDINRGWSPAGKVFRSMEKYGAQHPGTFCFFRPVYADLSWRPLRYDYGLVQQDGQLWVETFAN